MNFTEASLDRLPVHYTSNKQNGQSLLLSRQSPDLDKESRFEFIVCGTKAVIDYAIGPETIVFYHSSLRVRRALEGDLQEIHADMIRYVLEYARKNHLKIVPTCPHIQWYIRQHATEFFCIGKVFMAGE